MTERYDHLRERALAAPTQFNMFVKGLPLIGQLMTIAIIKGGVNHFMADSLPGLAKTRSVEVMSRSVEGKSHIIQGTPDLTPKDIAGSEYFDKEKSIWRI